ncbi:hypothetical protein [Thermasporomyces composti]|uniref:PIN domain-containing protein n=1 Tax=Thermasporomyces composti TaxID=696763 RepID=A0A3D9UZI2_THECX|nr:hypothetical protein [Thermasporomyces composti]REF34687.1 hypothetical protein DFJ64_0050 [Thermasporomyces composti]
MSGHLDIPPPAGWVLDIAPVLDIADGLVMAEALIATARSRALTLLVPDTVLLAAYDQRQEPSAIERLRGLTYDHDVWLLSSLTDIPTEQLDRLVEATGDVSAAHAAYLGHQRCWPVLTDRPDVLRRAHADLRLIPLSA